MAISTGALVGAAAISALGGILGGIISSKSSNRASTINRDMQRETNAQNERLFNQNLAWQEDMWNKTNEYNSPSNQIELLRKAGINPATVYGSGSNPTTTVPSAPSTPHLDSPQVTPVDYSWMGNIVDTGVNAYLSNSQLNQVVEGAKADAQIKKVQAEFDAQTLQDRCIRVMNDSKASEYQKDQARLTMEVLEGTKRQTILQSEQLTKIQQKQYDELVNKIVIQDLEKQSLTIANQYAPQLNEAQLNSLKAGMANLYASARANDAQALEANARKLLVDVQKEGAKISNKQAEKMMPHLINQARETVYKMEDERYERPLNYYQHHMGKAANYTITPGAAKSAATYMDIQEKRGRLTGRGKFYPKN